MFLRAFRVSSLCAVEHLANQHFILRTSAFHRLHATIAVDDDLEFYSPAVQQELQRVQHAFQRTIPLINRFPYFDVETKQRFVNELASAEQQQVRLLERMQRSSDPKCQTYVALFTNPQQQHTDPSTLTAQAPPTPEQREAQRAALADAQVRMRQRMELLRRLAAREASVPPGDEKQLKDVRRFIELVVALVWRAQELAGNPVVLDALQQDEQAKRLMQLCFADPVQGADEVWLSAFAEGRLGHILYKALENARMLFPNK